MKAAPSGTQGNPEGNTGPQPARKTPETHAESFLSNVPMIDFLTLTTFSPLAHARIRDWFLRGGYKTVEGTQRMQYLGETFVSDNGSAFLGQAMQKQRPHWIHQISGALAAAAFDEFRADLHEPDTRINVSRIDVQLTVAISQDEWSQFAFFRRMKARFKNGPAVQYFESKSPAGQGMLATVYVGRRTSDRLIRVYEKLGMGDDVFLRFEAEYKGALARGVARQMIDDEDSASGVLLWELERLDDDELRAYFSGIAGGAYAIRPKRIVVKTSRYNYIHQTAIPAIRNALAQHEGADDIALELGKILDSFYASRNRGSE